MRSAALLAWALVAWLFFGCARVPQESVELSATVGRDLAEVHRAHRQLALRYFEGMRGDVEEFVASVYRPYVIQTTMADLHLVDSIQAASAPGSPLDPADVMGIYVEETLAQIAEFRTSMLAPIEAQERQLLTSIDDVFQRLQNANAIVTGHLASVRKVRDTQEELLAGIGAPGLSDRIGGQLADFSSGVGRLLQGARRTEQLLDRGATELPKVKTMFERLPDAIERLARDATPRSDVVPPKDTLPQR